MMSFVHTWLNPDSSLLHFGFCRYKVMTMRSVAHDEDRGRGVGSSDTLETGVRAFQSHVDHHPSINPAAFFLFIGTVDSSKTTLTDIIDSRPGLFFSSHNKEKHKRTFVKGLAIMRLPVQCHARCCSLVASWNPDRNTDLFPPKSSP